MDGGGGDRKRIKKPHWTDEEDDKLMRVIDKHGSRDWQVIGAVFATRPASSCRQRWINQLSPEVQRTPFTPEEDAAIVEGYTKHGNKWAAIARCIPNRTATAIKWRWHWELRHRQENFVNVSPTGIRNDSSGPSSASASSGVGSCASELCHSQENPVNVSPPGIRSDSDGHSSSGSAPPLVVTSGAESRAPERSNGADMTFRLPLPEEISAAAPRPAVEDGGGDEAEGSGLLEALLTKVRQEDKTIGGDQREPGN